MSRFGNVPPDVLVGTVEKLVAKMDERDLATIYQSELSAMPADAFGVFVEAMFNAFRERGESSEDAVEGAGTTLERVAQRDGRAVSALLEYARTNAGLLKEATTLFVEQRPDLVAVLPAMLCGAIAERLSLVT
ncbi:MAG: hypothetical protein JOY69_03650 [Candidatus Eremiobacteraeota bacterium]|nr:hypothetical protein [Candidatus Eremiobacteraeota bacterium]